MVGITVLLGACLMAACGAMSWARKNAEARLFDIREARAATIAELSSLAGGVAEETGRGSWSEYVKVRGKQRQVAGLRLDRSGRHRGDRLCSWPCEPRGRRNAATPRPAQPFGPAASDRRRLAKCGILNRPPVVSRRRLTP
jgi:hypothetical protein